MSNCELNYPGAELTVQHCYEDYKNELDNYYRFYEKVNIALTVCGIILLVFLDNIDFGVINNLSPNSTIQKNLLVGSIITLDLGSAFAIVCVAVRLLVMMNSTKIQVFDSEIVRTEKQYQLDADEVAYRLTIAYLNCVQELRKINNEKQKKYDWSIKMIAASIIAYAVSIVIKKAGIL